MRGENGKNRRRATSAPKIKRPLMDVNVTSLSNLYSLLLSLFRTHTPIYGTHSFGTVTPKHHITKSVRNMTCSAASTPSGGLRAAVLTKQPGVQDSGESGRQVTMLLQTAGFHLQHSSLGTRGTSVTGEVRQVSPATAGQV